MRVEQEHIQYQERQYVFHAQMVSDSLTYEQGYYGSTTGLSTSICTGKCAAGTYSVSGATVCVSCAVGTYSSSSGLSTCTNCAAGYIFL